MTAEPVIWIVDCEHWPRAYLRAELIERGCDAVGFVEISQALAAIKHPHTARPCLIVLELRGQDLTQDALGSLAHSGIPTLLLGGAVELNDESVTKHVWPAAIQRPFSIGTLADTVEKLLNRAGMS